MGVVGCVRLSVCLSIPELDLSPQDTSYSHFKNKELTSLTHRGEQHNLSPRRAVYRLLRKSSMD